MENKYKNQKVLILGLGINQGGLGAAKFFAQAGARVKVTDLKDNTFLKPSLDALKDFPEIEYILGEHRFEDLDWADLIIRNPALKLDNPYLKYAREKGKRVEMDMGIFLEFVQPSQIVGVTGTKGKSTTASLIYEALKTSGKKVVFAGNIGRSVLDTIPYVKENTLVVLEISSFQLEAFEEHKTSPKYAVITNIYPDHLNYYNSLENYAEAKRIITKYQTKNDFLFLREGDKVTAQPDFLQGLHAQVVHFSTRDLPENFKPKLLGEHNLTNMAAALSVANKILASPDDLWCAWRTGKALENFSGVEFRLQLIYDKNDLRIYNDTAATNPDAAIQALQALPNSILITGGVNKNLPYEDLAKAIEKYTKAVYFLEGDATNEIINHLNPIICTRPGLAAKGLALQQAQGQTYNTYNSLEAVLADIKKIIQPGDTILFSPGAASFNLFQNEFDRGRKFNTAVEKIFR